MEAYLDSLLYRTAEEEFDLIVVNDCEVPDWLANEERLTVIRYDTSTATGIGRTRLTADVVRRHLRKYDPDEIRQITQPRWHAPGVLIGTVGANVDVCTRASSSLFEEYREAPSPVRAWLANNALGRSIFFTDRVYTPKYGGVDLPWWAPADLVAEERTVNADRFSPDAEPREGLFTQDDRRVLTVGRVSRRKGTDLLLSVAEQLENYEFVVAGPVGDETLVAEADATPNVTRHPPVEYVEMSGLYASSDLVLSVSRLEWGGVSRAMLEGKAAGRPVVALDREQASAVADTVVPGDPNAIASAVREHLD
jgi:glycosyltransferase involved in cell wall biosynthesis